MESFNRLIRCFAYFGLCLALFAIALGEGTSLAETTSIPLHELPQDTKLAIWGDSITEVTLYPRYLEAYLLACAGRKDIKVCTFGHSGERLGSLLSRQSDLEWFQPTVITFNYGMNDTQYSPYTEEKGADFGKTMRQGIDSLIARGINYRIVAGPGLVDDSYGLADPSAFFHGADPGGLTAAKAQNLNLTHFSQIGHAAAVDTSSAFADIHDRLEETYAAAKKVLGSDYTFAKPGGGIHPSANGHLTMAYEILKTLTMDGSIGTFTVDMKGKAAATTGHSIVSFSSGVLVVDSSRYPFCYGYDPNDAQNPESLASILPFLPFTKDLNRLMLVATNMDSPSARVTWGSETKSFTKDQLARGINLMEQFGKTPFDSTFSKVMYAIQNKQDFENYMIKLTSNFNGNDNGGNIDANMIAVQAQKDAAVKALIVPVRHSIVIVPDDQSDSKSPVITGTMCAYPFTDQPFEYQISAINSPTTYSASELPEGLSLDSASGHISGIPTKSGRFTAHLSAKNAAGTAMANLTFWVDAPLPDRPAITSPITAEATQGTPFTYQIVATNKPAHFFATTPSDKGTEPPSSSLPPGITYDSVTGLVSGTPTKAGSYIIQVAAMNDAGVSLIPVALTIKPQP